MSAPAPSPDGSSEPFDPILPQLLQRDMTGVYKQYGGLSTPLGRQMYALYNKEEDANKRAAARAQLASSASRAGKQPLAPQEQHAAQRQVRPTTTKLWLLC